MRASVLWNYGWAHAVEIAVSSWRLPGIAQLPRFALAFVWIQAQSCLFAFSLMGLIALTHFVELPWLFRNDWLFFLCLGIQWLMVRFRLETWRDATVVAVFHLLGVGLELYKVSQGSWFYPGGSVLSVGPVPLYAGFMYGSVASYMCLAWRKQDLRATGWPNPVVALPIGLAIYAQFFFNGWPLEVRLLMLAAVLWAFRKSVVHYGCIGERWRMPMPVAFVLIGSMIYCAENIGTYLGAWRYADQAVSWSPVHPMKLVAWILLMTVSLVIVAEYKRLSRLLEPEREAAQGASLL